MKVSVIGAGAWGTTIAALLVRNNHEVVLWAHELEVSDAINKSHENPIYLSGEKLPAELKATSDIVSAVKGCALLFFVTPSHHLRAVLKEAAGNIGRNAILVSCTKGIEEVSLLTMSNVIAQELKRAEKNIVALGGPSFAREVIKGLPAAVSAASHNEPAAKEAQVALSQDRFRVYVTDDVIGVELGGSVKNVIAIATGISDGLGLGANARAALITRGISELTRLGVKMGANPLTFNGLAGLGDMVLTCLDDLSRNRTVGLEIGKGRKLKDILAGMQGVAEGVRTCRAVQSLAKKYEIEMPIVQNVNEILYEDKNPRDAVFELMTRELKREREW